MNITGTIAYDPIHRVSNKKEYAVKRTHLAPGLQIVMQAMPHVSPEETGAYDLVTDYISRPEQYLATASKRIKPSEIDKAYICFESIAKYKSNHISIQNMKDFLIEVETKLCRTKTRPWTSIVRIDRESIEPYRRQLKKQKITITPSAWGPHITWVKREEPTEDGKLLWNFRNDEVIELQVTSDLVTNSRGYWWVNIESPQLHDYRRELGLNPRPQVPFHLTIGKEVSCAGSTHMSLKSIRESQSDTG